ncbi:hypothetical protein BXZ70DRAFT_1061152 [Cristinia sonorae]|uniref:HSF-type DNA-binding domain-containing protein n=1 Tax=Cristinia sonorae TaxID=1940300 RepID=A0A8K0UXQ2_9AGAR|nr:hypothetical protein BXZ70DRAFT_1061152 [Cristinia sonorae]
MMSTDQQLAVARPTRGESTHLSKAARQVVPPFLQKLYEIVNDPRNDELIRWSENGDSFYVLNHERFAREVLGRWFKHQKFTSFVRQLNMYGFHKVPHLQQGVLRSDSDTEPWHFEHPHFHRGQPDLLCLIQRKKQTAQGMPEDNIQMEVHEPAHVNAAPPLPNLTNGQVLDINSVVSGISAIKRHQQAISADLNELKTSNQQLWQEALAARERHKKHQDTINRILKFLAGVFGHTAGSGEHKTDGSPGSPPRVVIPRKRQRLMIQDVDKSKEPSVQEVEDEDDPMNAHETNFLPSANLNSVNTPDITIRSPSLAPSESFSPAVTDVSTNYFPQVQAIRPTDTFSRNSTVEPSNSTTSNGDTSSPAMTSVDSIHSLTTNSQSPNDQAAMWAIFQQMLNSPSSMQKIMQALASQQTYPMGNLSDPQHTPLPVSPSELSHVSPTAPSTSQQVTMYGPNPYDVARYQKNLPFDGSAAGPMLSALGPALHRDEDTSATSLEPLLNNATRLQKSYQDAADIESDVDALQLSINSLIEGLGLDPNIIATDEPHEDNPPTTHLPPKDVAGPSLTHSSSTLPATGSSSSVPPSVPTMSSISPALDPIPADPAPEFDFENFFNELSASARTNAPNGLQYPDSFGNGSTPMGIHLAGGSTGGDHTNPDQLVAFLDEVSSDTSTSPMAEEMSAKANKGKKRKSEVVELPEPLDTTNTSGHPTITLAEITPPKAKKKR